MSYCRSMLGAEASAPTEASPALRALPSGIKPFAVPPNCAEIEAAGPVPVPKGPPTAIKEPIPIGTRFVAVWVPSSVLRLPKGQEPTKAEIQKVVDGLKPISLNDAMKGEVVPSWTEPVGYSSKWTSKAYGNKVASEAPESPHYKHMAISLVGQGTNNKQKAMARYRLELARSIRVIWGPTYDPVSGLVMVGYQVVREAGEPAQAEDGTYSGWLYEPEPFTPRTLNYAAKYVGQYGFKREGLHVWNPMTWTLLQPYENPTEEQWFYPGRRLQVAAATLGQGIKHLIRQAPMSAVAAKVQKGLVEGLDTDIVRMTNAPPFLGSFEAFGEQLISQARTAAHSLPAQQAEAVVLDVKRQIKELSSEALGLIETAREVLATDVLPNEEERLRGVIATRLEGTLKRLKAEHTEHKSQHLLDWHACKAIKIANNALVASVTPLDDVRQKLPGAKNIAQQLLATYEGSVPQVAADLQRQIEQVESELGLAWWERRRAGLPTGAWAGLGVLALGGGIVLFRRSR